MNAAVKDTDWKTLTGHFTGPSPESPSLNLTVGATPLQLTFVVTCIKFSLNCVVIKNYQKYSRKYSPGTSPFFSHGPQGPWRRILLLYTQS